MQKIANFPQNQQLHTLLLLPAAVCLLLVVSSKASAQIIPDSTLPDNSVITPNGDAIEITGGTTAGGNLFHSFEQFSLPTGNIASFNNPQTIENIISRVTGNSISNIDGLIRANGSANLFLINPNGIIFGEHATLNIGGSFIGSTANSIKFADGSEFSATNPQASSLLTVSIPVGLQYGANAGDITVNGTGNQIEFNEDFTVNRDFRPVGLQVGTGQTLALVGGNISLDGGNLTAESGRIELGSVEGEALVSIAPTNPGWTLGYENVVNFQDINLSNAASVEVSGNRGGDAHLQGRLITVADGSTILADTLGNGSGGTLLVKAQEALEVFGTSILDLPFISRLSTDVVPRATGNGGNIDIETGHLVVADGAQIISSTYDLGDTGNITVKADTIELISGSPVVGPSGVFTLVFASGAGSDINLEADSIFAVDGAQAAALTFGNGNAGNLTVKANNLELAGTSPNGAPTSFSTNAEVGASGKGGNLSVETENLLLTDGAQILALTLDAGNAGNLTIKAKNIELSGISSAGLTSSLGASVGVESTGNGGNLTIDTETLRLSGGAQIAVSTAGSGNAGEMNVRADRIELIGGSEDASSGLFASAIIDTGNGGNLNISTDRLTIRDGATISSSNFSSREAEIPPGLGKAGNIQIEANSVEIDNNSSSVPSSITASTFSKGGGNVELKVRDSLIARNNSQISAETKGEGNGGNINLSTNLLDLANGASISTNSEGIGQAGNINIFANQFDSDRGQITATSLQSGGGNINLAIDNNTILKNNSLISTSVLDSTGGGGNINIDTNLLVALENSDLRANAVFGTGGNIQIATQGIFQSADSDISVSSRFGVDGTFTIIDPDVNKKIDAIDLPENVVDPNQKIARGCMSEPINSLVVSGKGGLPDNPSQTLRSQSLWSDLRLLEGDRVSQSRDRKALSISADTHKSPIVEAQSWIFSDRGNIELLVTSSDSYSLTSWQQGDRCIRENN